MKNTLEITSVSSKGQIVIPQIFREQIGIKNGSKLLVLSDGESVLLKPISSPKIQEFASLIRESRAFARRSGLKKSDVAKALKRVRHVGRA